MCPNSCHRLEIRSCIPSAVRYRYVRTLSRDQAFHVRGLPRSCVATPSAEWLHRTRSSRHVAIHMDELSCANKACCESSTHDMPSAYDRHIMACRHRLEPDLGFGAQCQLFRSRSTYQIIASKRHVSHSEARLRDHPVRKREDQLAVLKLRIALRSMWNHMQGLRLTWTRFRVCCCRHGVTSRSWSGILWRHMRRCPGSHMEEKGMSMCSVSACLLSVCRPFMISI